MPSVHFTAQWLKSLQPPDEGQVDYFDSAGLGEGRSFGLRVSYGGKMSWFVLYRRNGKLRRLTLDTPYPRLGLKDAREAADVELHKILGGGDPARAKQAAKVAPTFESFAADYIQKYAKTRKRSWERDQEILNRDVLPEWGERKAREIKRADVLDLVEGIRDRGAPIAANRTLALVRRMYNWALERDAYGIEANPAHKVKAPAAEHQRDRVLTADEIKALWSRLPDTDLTEPLQIAIKLTLATAQRKGEVLGAAKAEFDLKAGWWTIPAARAKNKLAHRVPLSPLAVTLIERAMVLAKDSPHLFPSPRGKGAAPVLDSALNRAVLRNAETFGIDHWTPHDLRRTAASHMAGMKVPRLVISKILNHVERGVTAVYDRHSYDDEKRAALEQWAERVEAITGKKRKPAKVVRLRA